MDRSAVGLQDSRKDLYEGRLAGAVLSHQREDLASGKFQVDRFQCAHAGKGFFQASYLENGVFGVQGSVIQQSGLSPTSPTQRVEEDRL